MIRPALFISLLALPVPPAAAADAWDESLARKLSGRLRAIEAAIQEIVPQLEGLPQIPIADQGGTGGWAGVHASAAPAVNARHAVEIKWSEPAAPDWIALVPARRYDARGLDARHGLPDAFSVELIDANGVAAKTVAREHAVRSHPVRNGHPFVYQIAQPIEAAGLRIVADRLPPDVEEPGSFVHAWAEVFVFAGDRDLARNAEVRGIGGSQPPSPWHWAPEFLTDSQTPLGLPEIPAPEHRNVGWLSEGRNRADQAASITIELSGPQPVEAVRLLPARRPTPELPSGFGFPREIRISFSDSGTPGAWSTVFEGELRNPGHNPLRVELEPAVARHIKIEATRLWKEFDAYPAFFALSEVELLSGNINIAPGNLVRASDGMQNLIAPGGRFWTTTALIDGHGPDGRLVATREWLDKLDHRLQLETRIHKLRIEAAQIISSWRRAVLTLAVLLGAAGAIAIIALPIRYRIQANRELHRVRERIAGDLHDEVGSNLGSIQMLADLAEGRSGPSKELKRIQRIAAETVSAVRDIVWLLRSNGDHRIATVEHMRETASIMLESLQWKFTANEAGWGTQLPEESNRDLFLFFREALHNILRHSQAGSVKIHLENTGRQLLMEITDDGCGIPPEKTGRPATLRALRQRAAALNADFQFQSTPQQGTTLRLAIPLPRHRMGPQAGN
jgi:signal transduction histidine kinase